MNILEEKYISQNPIAHVLIGFLFLKFKKSQVLFHLEVYFTSY